VSTGLAARSILDDSELGVRMLGVSTLGFGIACLLQRDFVVWQPVPEDFPFRQPLAFVSAAALMLSGSGLLVAGTRKIAVILQMSLFLLYAASWLFVSPSRGSVQPWLGIAEHLAIVVGATTIWARLSPATAQRWHFNPKVARVAYGCCSLAFAIAHVVALKGTASFVPAWIPGDAVFWAIFTGVGHLAVAIALFADKVLVLATRLAALMYLSFAALVWMPGAVTHPDQWFRWAGGAITLVLLAAVWLVGEYRRAEDKVPEGPDD